MTSWMEQLKELDSSNRNNSNKAKEIFSVNKNKRQNNLVMQPMAIPTGGWCNAVSEIQVPILERKNQKK